MSEPSLIAPVLVSSCRIIPTSVGVLDGIRKIVRLAGQAASAAAMAEPRPAVVGVSHGTTVATNALLPGAVPGLGLIVTRGFRHMLEIARQSVPQGYGNSYFWVKPERIVPLHRVREVAERMDFQRRGAAPVRRGGGRGGGRAGSASAASLPSACASCTPTPTASTSSACATCSSRVHPGRRTCRISSEVLPEYREYERAVTTLVDAFVKPRVGRLRRRDPGAGRARGRPGVPFYIMKSNGGVISAREVAAQPITTMLSGPAAGALGAALLARAAGFRHVLTLDGGGTSTDVAVVERRRAAADDRRRRRPVPGQGADDRHRHGRRRRRLDRLARAGRGAQGRARAARAPIPGRCATAAAAPADGHRRDAGARPHPAAPARRRDPARRRRWRTRASTDWPARSASIASRAAGASSRSRPGARRTPCAR